MLVTLIAWPLLYGLALLYGWGAVRMLACAARQPVQAISRTTAWLLGLLTLAVLSQSFSLFMPLGWPALVLVLGLGLGIVLWAWRMDRAVSLLALLKPARLHPLAAVLALVCFFTVLEVSTHIPANPDSGIYHAQTIRWLESAAAVPGLGNFHHRLAYNSAWLSLNALFSFAFSGLQSFHFLPGLFFLVTAFSLCGGVSNFLRGRASVADGLRLLLLPLLFWTMSSEAASPGTDLPAALITWLVLTEWLDNGSDLQRAALALSAVLGLMFKLSMLPLALLAVVWAVPYLARRQFRPVVGLVGLGLLGLLPWLARNVILSGYLVYPQAALDLFAVDWKIPLDSARADQRSILAWGRVPRMDAAEVLALPLRTWVQIWFAGLTWNQRGMLAGALAAPLLYGGLFWLRKFPRAAELWRDLRPGIFPLWVVECGVIFWFFSAPSFRFGYGFLISALCLGLLPLLWLGLKTLFPVKIQRWLPWLIAALLIVFQVGILVRSVDSKSLADRLLLPADYRSLPTTPCQFSNFDALCADSYQECWYDPFPCVPSAQADVEMRGTTLWDGFRVR